VDTAAALRRLVARCREVGSIAVDTETVLDPGAPPIVTPMRANLVSISIAVAPGEAYYLPFAHRGARAGQGDLDLGEATAAPVTKGIKNLAPLVSDEVAPLRALLEDPSVKKTAHNAKYDLLVLRRAGITLRGLDFDSMLASYVHDPGRRSHAIDALALEFLGRSMTTTRSAAKARMPYRSTKSRLMLRGTIHAPMRILRCNSARCSLRGWRSMH
jgi:DNA polymerase-1